MLAIEFPPGVGKEVLAAKADDFTRENESYRSEAQLDCEISDVLSSLRNLLLKYKMYNRASDTPAVSGGLQQFIINKLKKRGEGEKSLTQRLRAFYMGEESVHFALDVDAERSVFDSMPVDIRLHIFSFLDARSLCRAACVSRGWNQVLWDELLWRRRLEIDRRTWSQVSHTSNIQVYAEAASDLPYKEM
jgi:hypothetical protein